MKHKLAMLSVLGLMLALLTAGAGLSAQVPSGPSPTALAQIPQSEYDALLALHKSTGGPDWFNRWQLPTDDPCGLYGVTCSDGHVSQLVLDENDLSGSIPPELGNLSGLERLYLDHNQLSGAIPPELGQLDNIQVAYLSANQLTGTMPPELGAMASLRLLSLQDNQLSGAIPPELGAMSSLDALYLHHNQLTGPVPMTLVNLPDLGACYLFDNDLCEPQHPAFQAWKLSVSDWRGTDVPCPVPEYWLFLPLAGG